MKWVTGGDLFALGETDPAGCFSSVEAALAAADAPAVFTVSPEHVVFLSVALPDGYLLIGPAPVTALDTEMLASCLEYAGQEAGKMPELSMRLGAIPCRDILRTQNMAAYLAYAVFGLDIDRWEYAQYPPPVKTSAAYPLRPASAAQDDDYSINRYLFGRQTMQAVRYGKVMELENHFAQMGTVFQNVAVHLPSAEDMHDKFIYALATASGAAVMGGMSPSVAEALETHYLAMLKKVNGYRDIVRLFKLMMIDYAARTAQTQMIQTNDAFIQSALRTVEHSLHEKLTPTLIARQLRVSPSYLSNAFKKETGKTVSTYINERKIAESKYLLAQPDATITQTAVALGYSSANYFSTVFKQATGQTPARYLKKQKENG